MNNQNYTVLEHNFKLYEKYIEQKRTDAAKTVMNIIYKLLPKSLSIYECAAIKDILKRIGADHYSSDLSAFYDEVEETYCNILEKEGRKNGK